MEKISIISKIIGRSFPARLIRIFLFLPNIWADYWYLHKGMIIVFQKRGLSLLLTMKTTVLCTDVKISMTNIDVVSNLVWIIRVWIILNYFGANHRVKLGLKKTHRTLWRHVPKADWSTTPPKLLWTEDLSSTITHYFRRKIF